jgi:hypothetical protein
MITEMIRADWNYHLASATTTIDGFQSSIFIKLEKVDRGSILDNTGDGWGPSAVSLLD